MSMDDGLIQEFVAEARDHLANIEPDLLLMEKDGKAVGQDIINRIFRAIHSIKGAAGFFGFERLKKLSHVMESVLMKIRDGETDPTPTIVEPLLKGVDRLNEMVADIDASESINCDAEVQALDAILNGNAPPAPQAAKPVEVKPAVATSPAVAAADKPVEPVSYDSPYLHSSIVPYKDADVKQAMDKGLFLFQLTFPVDKAFEKRTLTQLIDKLAATGTIYTHSAYSAPDNLPASLDGLTELKILFSTVLERDLMMAGYELPEDCIQAVTPPTGPVALDTNLYNYSEPAVQEAARFGHRFYQLELLPETDLKARNRTLADFTAHLRTAGNVYINSPFSNPALLPEQTDHLANVLLFYSSVLELDLLCLSFDLDASRVKVISKERALGQDCEEELLQQLIESQLQEQAAEQKTSTEKVKPKKSTASESTETVRVRVDLLNKMMDLAGEMVLSRNQLLSTLEGHGQNIPNLASILQNVDLVTSDLQEHIMQTRMQTIGTVFNKFPRVVRDIAKTLGKEINLVMTGEDVELDKSIIESLSDPLTHLIRNCCDHGIEKPVDRVKAGKPAFGTIQLKAYHEAGQINIAIIDDGKGIDPHKILQKALMTGAIDEADVKKMSPQDMVNLIFLPGLSTAEKVSDISGRGVGMDVVRTNIEQIGGSIQIDSQHGAGTTILLRLPLTLAIIPSLIMGVAGQKFAMPQINVLEMVRVHARDLNQRIEQVGSASVLRLRGTLLPLLDLSQVLQVAKQVQLPDETLPERRKNIADVRQVAQDDTALSDELPENRRVSKASDVNIMVLKAGKFRYGLIVDELFDIEEIVVKPLSNYLKNCRCFAGATIMGDGRVAMILDATGIMQYAKLSFSDLDALNDKIDTEVAEEDGMTRQSVIMFNIAPEELFAIPLASVLRLEKINNRDIESVGNREFLPYRGKGLPLLRLENHLPIGAAYPKDGQDADYSYLIIPKCHIEGHAAVGIVVSEIVDTLEVNVRLQDTLSDYPGVDGSALVNGHMTVFINADGILQYAGINQQPAVV
jgi:two-component system, chemotaxis family, sensor kinase CheA